MLKRYLYKPKTRAKFRMIKECKDVLKYCCLFVSITVIAFQPLQAISQEIDLLLKGGHVIDPKNKVDSKMDVAIKGGKIFRVAADIQASTAKKQLT